MDSKLIDSYVAILKEELLPAMGCTEPIAVAYAAAYLRKILGVEPGIRFWPKSPATF